MTTHTDRGMTIHYTPSVTVHELAVRWDLYWTMADDSPEMARKLEAANTVLTAAAVKALESNDPSIWERAADRLDAVGAADTEPRWQFTSLWRKVYGGEAHY